MTRGRQSLVNPVCAFRVSPLSGKEKLASLVLELKQLTEKGESESAIVPRPTGYILRSVDKLTPDGAIPKA